MSVELISMSNVMAINFLEHIGIMTPTQEQIDVVEKFIVYYSKSPRDLLELEIFDEDENGYSY